MRKLGYKKISAEQFDEMVRTHAKSVYGFVYRLVGKDSAEDVTQETFIKAWKNLKKYDSTRSFKPWVFSIARNTSIDWLRKRKLITFSQIDEKNGSDDSGGNGGSENFGNMITDMEPLADEIFDRNIDMEKSAKIVETALAQISFDQKTVVLMHHYDELTFEEIAEALDKPMNTVKSQYRRAIIALHQIIKPNRNK